MSDASILGFKEKLTQQLSGDQIEEILDGFLISAITPIVQTTYFVEDCLTEMLPLVIDNRRRKISPFPNDELSAKVFSFVVTNSFDTKIDILKEIQLERSILFYILENFYSICANYERAMPLIASGRPKKRYMEAVREAESALSPLTFKTKRLGLFYALQESKYYADLAYRFRNMIVEKYVRFIYTRAVKYQKSTQLNINLKDLFKDLIISAFKAVDKYRSVQGTLTIFLSWWLKDGVTQSSTNHEYGVAYHIPAARRRSMIAKGKQVSNFSHQLDDKVVENTPDELLEEKVIQNDEHEKLMRVAAQSVKNNLAFLSLGLQYSLTGEEKDMLRKTLS